MQRTDYNFGLRIADFGGHRAESPSEMMARGQFHRVNIGHGVKNGMMEYWNGGMGKDRWQRAPGSRQL